jgi:SPP1 gp7 family putative phage head morphogenesis protein
MAGLGLRAYRQHIHGHDLRLAVHKTLTPLVPLLTQAGVAAHLDGRLRTVRAAAAAMSDRKKSLGAYDEAVLFTKSRLALTERDISELTQVYGKLAVRVTGDAAGLLEQRASEAMGEIVEQGLHVGGGVTRMREAFDAAGFTPANPFTLENIVRTQIQMAYGAGRWNASEDDAIQEILWGHEYVTVGDDRVREEHALLEGTRAPHDDPIWNEIWTPNGFSCRCSIMDIFNGDEGTETQYPPEGAHADEGWNFNPGKVFADMFPR